MGSTSHTALEEAEKINTPDLRSVPQWVRNFFHPQTLRETLKFAAICRKPGYEFLMACLLGILHHQRPGFLSYPSSHLVPYLRNKKYPKKNFPEMYEYRQLKPRLLSKIERSYKRLTTPIGNNLSTFVQSNVLSLSLPQNFDCIITSPPYMNALDYGRDNRLRLWLIAPDRTDDVDNDVTQGQEAFIAAITNLAAKIEKGLKRQGYCIFIVGEEFRRSFKAHPSESVIYIMEKYAPSLSLNMILTDQIPDIRRTRRECSGVKMEHFLIFRRR